MKFPVDKPEFWKERIARAEKDKLYHYSVYLTNPANWEKIAETHKAILQRECPGFRVLDAGCGYGRVSEWFPDNKYFGVDLSPDFITKAKATYPRKQFSQAHLTHLPFPRGAFDIAFCISIRAMTINNLGETAWQEIENELRRVAKKILILEYEDPETYFII